MTKLAFVDTETTGLDPERHEMWDLAILVRDGPEWQNGEWQFQFPVDPARADPTALRINHFYERRTALPWGCATAPSILRPQSSTWDHKRSVAGYVAKLLDGAHIVGAVPNFDTGFIAPYLRANGHAPTWHYHLITVECLAVGYLASRGTAVSPPWSSDALGALLGVEPPTETERHTAVGDARWAMRMYDAVGLGRTLSKGAVVTGHLGACHP